MKTAQDAVVANPNNAAGWYQYLGRLVTCRWVISRAPTRPSRA